MQEHKDFITEGETLQSNLRLQMLFLGLGLLGVFGGIVFLVGVRGWWPWLVVLFGLSMLVESLRRILPVVKDLEEGAITIEERVAHKRENHDEIVLDGGVLPYGEYWIEVAGRKMAVSQKIYHWVRARDEVVVTFYPHTNSVANIVRTATGQEDAPKPRYYPRTIEEKAEAEREHHLGVQLLDLFSDLGVDARSLGSATPLRYSADCWIEITEGPIRWFSYTFDDYMSCYVPDPRIGTNFPPVASDLVLIKRAQNIGSVESLRWKSDNQQYSTISLDKGKDEKHRRFIVDSLNRESAAGLKVLASGIRITPGWGCCMLPLPDDIDLHLQFDPDNSWGEELPMWDEETLELKVRPMWNRYQAIAESLLALPIPTDEEA